MASRFIPRRGLDETVARVLARPAVERALSMLRDEAETRAPRTRVWVTARDERVRATHIETDTQVVPDNLRFRIPTAPGARTFDLARHPGDPDLPIEQRINCRCDDPYAGDLLAKSLATTTVIVTGTRAAGKVYTDFPRAAESENGGDGDEPAHYMAGALQEVAARLRAGHAR